MAVAVGRYRVHVKKGDTVEIVNGKHRGKRGKVLQVLTKDGKVIVEGVNILKRHSKPTQKLPQGGIVEKEGAVFSGRVMLVCPKCAKLTRVGHGYLGDGTKVRVCKQCGEQFEK